MTHITDEDAKETLQGLGFTVVDANDYVVVGYRLIYRQKFGNWAIESVHRHRDATSEDAVTYMTEIVGADPVNLARRIPELLYAGGF